MKEPVWKQQANVNHVTRKYGCIVWGFGINNFFSSKNVQFLLKVTCTLHRNMYIGLDKHVAWKCGHQPLTVICYISDMGGGGVFEELPFQETLLLWCFPTLRGETITNSCSPDLSKTSALSLWCTMTKNGKRYRPIQMLGYLFQQYFFLRVILVNV